MLTNVEQDLCVSEEIISSKLQPKTHSDHFQKLYGFLISFFFQMGLNSENAKQADGQSSKFIFIVAVGKGDKKKTEK